MCIPLSCIQREKDALLETHLEVDYATKLSTPITEEVSMEIEEIIRARIRDLAFDDVKPRVSQLYPIYL